MAQINRYHDIQLIETKYRYISIRWVESPVNCQDDARADIVSKFFDLFQRFKYCQFCRFSLFRLWLSDSKSKKYISALHKPIF